MQNPFDDLPGFDLLKQALNFGQPSPPQPTPTEKRTAKPGGAKGAGGGSAPGGGAKTKTTSSSKDKAWDDSPAELGEHHPEPVADPVETKPKATLKKWGWVQDKTQFKSEAEIFAEFTVPASEKHRTLVEFELLIKERGDFKVVETAKGHADANGRATAKVPIRKPAEAAKATFALKAKHCTADWSKETGTEREVTETAEQGFEHTQVSGIHFTKNKSFIAPQYLNVFRTLESEFKSWRAQRETAKIVIYGHAERDEEDPRKLSARRSQAAFAFLIGDYHMWNRIATEERWGLWEQQHMLQALGFYEGKVDGISGPATKKAIRDFITWLNENECKNLNPLLGLTEEHIRLELYRVYITGAKRTVIMPSSHFRLVSGNPFVGCGAFNRYKGGEESYPENRRATFLLIADSFSFPVIFPCRSSTSGPCESETQKPGERAVKGFGCKFYDEVMQKEKAGEGVSQISSSIFTVIDEKALVRKSSPPYDSTGDVLPYFSKLSVVSNVGEYSTVKLNGEVVEKTTSIKNYVAFIKDDPAFKNASLKPQNLLSIDPKWSANQKVLAGIYNRLGGLFQKIGDVLELEVEAAIAVWRVESGGKSHSPNQAIIRFENHHFWKFWGKENADKFDTLFKFGGRGSTGKVFEGHQFSKDGGKTWQDCHGSQTEEYEVLKLASGYDKEAAIKSISIGGCQIMVSNHAICGYKTASDMYEAFQADEKNHVLGFFDFCKFCKGWHKGNDTMFKYASSKDWEGFASVYNGPENKEVYGKLIGKAYEEVKSVLA